MGRENQKLVLAAITGHKVQFTRHEMTKIVGSFQFVMYFFLAITVAVTGKLTPELSLSANHVSFVAVLCAMSSYVLVYNSLLGVLYKTSHIFRMRFVFTPALAAVAVAVAVKVAFFILGPTTFFADNPDISYWKEFAYSYFLALTFDTIAILSVIPEILCRIRRSEMPKVTVMEGMNIKIGGVSISKKQLLYISANAHHVNVTTEKETVQLRARLSDVVAQMTSDDGIQPHRSYWIAKNAIKGIGTENGKMVIKTVNGQKFSVSKARKIAVLDWLKQMSIVEN